MNNILIIGCGLIGSSIMRAVYKKKIAKKIFVLEKSKNNISKIKKLNLKCQIIKNFKNEIPKMDMIIFCTHLSNYEDALKKINNFLNKKGSFVVPIILPFTNTFVFTNRSSRVFISNEIHSRFIEFP